MKLHCQRDGNKVKIIVEMSIAFRAWSIEFTHTLCNELEACLLYEKLQFEVLPKIAQAIGRKSYLLGWKHAKAKQKKTDTPDYFSPRLEDV